MSALAVKMRPPMTEKGEFFSARVPVCLLREVDEFDLEVAPCSIAELVKQGRYDFCTPTILARSEIIGSDLDLLGYCLPGTYHCHLLEGTQPVLTLREVIESFEALEKHSANPWHILALGVDRPNLQRMSPIFSMQPIRRDPRDHRELLNLAGSPTERNLFLSAPPGKLQRCRFLAVDLVVDS